MVLNIQWMKIWNHFVMEALPKCTNQPKVSVYLFKKLSKLVCSPNNKISKFQKNHVHPVFQRFTFTPPILPNIFKPTTKPPLYLKWRYWTLVQAILGILGVGFPLHKTYSYSLCRWGFLHFMVPTTCLVTPVFPPRISSSTPRRGSFDGLVFWTNGKKNIESSKHGFTRESNPVTVYIYICITYIYIYTCI